MRVWEGGARLKDEWWQRGMAIRPRTTKDLLQQTSRVHFWSAREVENLEDSVAEQHSKGRRQLASRALGDKGLTQASGTSRRRSLSISRS